MGRFTQYLGKLEITVDGQKLELDAQLKDKEKLMKTQTMKDEDKKVGLLTEVFMDIIKRSYPEEPVSELESFVDKNYLEYMQELMIAFKWASKEDFDTVKKNKLIKG
jgi:hypothetical protein